MTTHGSNVSSIEFNNQFDIGAQFNPKTDNSRPKVGDASRTLTSNSPTLENRQRIDGLSSSLNMTAESDGLDGKIVSDEPKLSKEDPQETRHLKELLLLHLDWIQQQQEVLIEKDRQIQRLKQEKEALKCRLERMDRRMSLLQQKRHQSTSKIQAQPSPSINPQNRSSVPANSKFENHGKGIKRKRSLEPQNLCSKFDAVDPPKSPKIQTATKSTSTEEEKVQMDTKTRTPVKANRSRLSLNRSGRKDSPVKSTCLFSQQPPRKCRLQSENKSDEDQESEKGELEIEVESESEEEEEEEEEVHNERNDLESDDEVQIMDQSAWKRLSLAEKSQQNTPSKKERSYMRTANMYYVSTEEYLETCEISPKKKQPCDVLVPTYRIRHVPTGYQLEGTENLTDEAYLKRHMKPEVEEKRRKRWDAQMMREQKMLERLQSRNAKSACKNGGGSSKFEDEDLNTLLPNPDQAKFIEMSDKIVVSAFGYPIPVIEPVEFTLPWFDLDRRTREERGKSHRGRRK